MAAFPNQQSTSPQTLGSNNTVFITETRFDSTYLKTLPGMVKVAVIILNLIGFICIQSSTFWYFGRGVYFNVVATIGFWFSGILLVLYLFHVVEKYHKLKWLKVEMVGCAVICFLYLIGSTVVVAFGAAAFSAAGFFGYLAMVLYGFDAFLKWRAWREGELAQGQRVVTKQTHVLTPPSLP